MSTIVIKNSLSDQQFSTRLNNLTMKFFTTLIKKQHKTIDEEEQEKGDISLSRTPLGTISNICRETKCIKNKIRNFDSITDELKLDVVRYMIQLQKLHTEYRQLLQRNLAIQNKTIYLYSGLLSFNDTYKLTLPLNTSINPRTAGGFADRPESVLLKIKTKMCHPIIPIMFIGKLRSFDYYADKYGVLNSWGTSLFGMEYEIFMLPGVEFKIVSDKTYESIKTPNTSRKTYISCVKHTLSYLLNNHLRSSFSKTVIANKNQQSLNKFEHKIKHVYEAIFMKSPLPEFVKKIIRAKSFKKIRNTYFNHVIKQININHERNLVFVKHDKYALRMMELEIIDKDYNNYNIFDAFPNIKLYAREHNMIIDINEHLTQNHH
jgi:hypothetical protein